MTNPEKTPVNALTFTTGFGSRGDWIVYETDGRLYRNVKDFLLLSNYRMLFILGYPSHYVSCMQFHFYYYR